MQELDELIQQYLRANAVRFHVPSHKGRGEDPAIKRVEDITELSFSDNLMHPQGVLASIQEEIAKLFGARESMVTLNGSSSAIIAAVSAAAREDGEVLVPSNAHVSAYHACLHAGAKAIRFEVADPVKGASVAEIEDAIARYPHAAVMIIVSPTYLGYVGDIAAACEACKRSGVTAIVDEAHGTHLRFGTGYPKSAISAGADIVVHSGYKTVNGPVQTALLHSVSGKVSGDNLHRWLRTVHTTSPSYPLMLSLFDAISELKYAQNAFERVREWYNILQESLSSSPVYLANASNADDGLAHTDFFKIPLDFRDSGISAYKMEEVLYNEYKIVAESCDDDILLLAAGMNSTSADMQILNDALSRLLAGRNPVSRGGSGNGPLPVPTSALDMRRAMHSECESAPLSRAAGRVSADFVSLYPPGSPILIPGDIISRQVAEYLASLPEKRLAGVNDARVTVIRQ